METSQERKTCIGGTFCVPAVARAVTAVSVVAVMSSVGVFVWKTTLAEGFWGQTLTISERATSLLILCVVLGMALITPPLVWYDLTQRRLPNVLTGACAIVVGCVWMLTMFVQQHTHVAPLWGACIAFGTALSVALTGQIGMGDVKLVGLSTFAIFCILETAQGTVAASIAASSMCLGAICVAGMYVGVHSLWRRSISVVKRASGQTISLLVGASTQPPSSVPASIAFGPFVLAAFWTVLLVSF